MKEKRIKALLDVLANDQNANTWMHEYKKFEIAEKLVTLNKANIESVQKIIESSSFLIKNTVDFSSISYLLVQIAEIINEE